MSMPSVFSQCKHYSTIAVLSATTFLFSFSTAQANSDLKQIYTTTVVADDLGVIWGMDWIDAHRLLMSERNGHVYMFDLKSKQKTKISGLPDIKVSGQGGLLDVARFTDHNKQDWFYFTYVKPLNHGDSATTLARAQLDITNKKLTHWQDLLVTHSADNSSKHFGSRIAFDDSGHIFFGVGDRGERDNGQNPQNHAATLLRLNIDGSIPKGQSICR